MKIVVLDGYTENPGDLSWEGLGRLGSLTVYDRTPSEEIVKRMGDAEAVYTNKTPISADAIGLCPNLRFIGVLATGYDVVDTQAARESGVVVCNIPTYGTDAVAQYAIALLLEMCHHVGEHSDCVKKGEWTHCQDWCFWRHPLVELAGKTLGIIGFGRIGQRTARLGMALGMQVLAYDECHVEGLETQGCRYAGFEEVLSSSDIISLHCPLLPSTRGLINRRTIHKMKDGVKIINTSRGPLIVEEDLREALDSGKVSGAAVDVVSAEPIREDNPLMGAKNIIITPHIAWAPKESRQRLLDIAVGNLRHFVEGEPRNVVNGP